MNPAEPPPPEPLPEPPVFAEPWQAQAFALAVCLQDAGLIGRDEWSAAFSANIAQVEAAGGAIDAERYHQLWLETLERLSLERDLARPRELAERRDAWAQAYRDTPHGMPVELG